MSVKMRLTGTQTELDKWLKFLGRVENKELINILETSSFYPNRGSSKLGRQYMEIELLVIQTVEC